MLPVHAMLQGVHGNINVVGKYFQMLCCKNWQFSFVQQSNDTCLAYTLAAISNLLFENGISSTAATLGSSYSPFTSIGISLSVQQQLFVLLRGSLKRAESLKLKRLVASNHLAMAKFDLTVMKFADYFKLNTLFILPVLYES